MAASLFFSFGELDFSYLALLLFFSLIFQNTVRCAFSLLSHQKKRHRLWKIIFVWNKVNFYDFLMWVLDLIFFFFWQREQHPLCGSSFFLKWMNDDDESWCLYGCSRSSHNIFHTSHHYMRHGVMVLLRIIRIELKEIKKKLKMNLPLGSETLVIF